MLRLRTIRGALLGLGVAAASAFATSAAAAEGFGEKARFTTPAISDPRFVVRVDDGAFLVGSPAHVMKFSKAGKRVTRFGEAGSVSVPPGDGSTIRALDSLPDGGFAVLTAKGEDVHDEVTLRSFTADGEARMDFGGDGSVEIGQDRRPFEPQLEVDHAGRIVVGASNTLTRFTPSGLPDPSFGPGGSVTLEGRAVGGDIEADSSGRLLALTMNDPITTNPYIGNSNMDTQVLRLLDDGRPDPTFQNQGEAELYFYGIFYEFLALDRAGGSIFAAEQPGILSDLRFAQATVSLDGDGDARRDFGGGYVSLPHVGMAVDRQGRLALAGTPGRRIGPAAEGNERSFYLARLRHDGGLRGKLRFVSFGERRATMTAVSGPRNGKIIVVGRVADAGGTGGSRDFDTGMAQFSLK